MIMKIMATTSDSFTAIQNALQELDPTGDFLSNFRVAEQSEKDVTGITVLLRNSKRFTKDLNKNKYVIAIPNGLLIDSFEHVTTFIQNGHSRVPSSNIILKCHMLTNSIKFVIILGGFSMPAIRVVRMDEIEIVPPKENEDSDHKNQSSTVNAQHVITMEKPKEDTSNVDEAVSDILDEVTSTDTLA